MKIKTSELSGAVLDWAVAKCEEQEVIVEDGGLYLPGSYFNDGDFYTPSTDWAQGGPIIEREGIALSCHASGWIALPCGAGFSEEAYQEGQTQLIAAMRCYVTSKLGDEIEVTNEVQS